MTISSLYCKEIILHFIERIKRIVEVKHFASAILQDIRRNVCGEARTHYEPRYAYRLWNVVQAGSLYFTGTKSFVSERCVACIKINYDIAYCKLAIQKSPNETRILIANLKLAIPFCNKKIFSKY